MFLGIGTDLTDRQSLPYTFFLRYLTVIDFIKLLICPHSFSDPYERARQIFCRRLLLSTAS